MVVHIVGNAQGTAVNTGLTGLQSISDQADMDKSYRLVRMHNNVIFSFASFYLYGANHVVKSHQQSRPLC